MTARSFFVRWLEAPEIRAIHNELLVEHGGLAGTRDDRSLERTLAELPLSLQAEAHSLADIAAAYGCELMRHPQFPGGNRQTALAAIAVFLHLNGYELIAPQVDAVYMMLHLSANELAKPELARWISRHMHPLDTAEPESKQTAPELSAVVTG